MSVVCTGLKRAYSIHSILRTVVMDPCCDMIKFRVSSNIGLASSVVSSGVCTSLKQPNQSRPNALTSILHVLALLSASLPGQMTSS